MSEAKNEASELNALLEAKVARTIFLVMMPPNMVMADWDSGAVLGENNEYRKKIEMAAKLAVIDMTSI